jgi:hypothetical protein
MIHVNISLSAASDLPSIGNFAIGSQTSLGLETEQDGSTWYLVVTNAQDYENPNQRLYRFSVTAGGVRNDVVLRDRKSVV